MASDAFANYSNMTQSLRSSLEGPIYTESQEKENDARAFQQELLNASTVYAKEKFMEAAGKGFASSKYGGKILKALGAKDPTPLRTARMKAEEEVRRLGGTVARDGERTIAERVTGGIDNAVDQVAQRAGQAVASARNVVQQAAGLVPVAGPDPQAAADEAVTNAKQATAAARATLQQTTSDLADATEARENAQSLLDTQRAMAAQAETIAADKEAIQQRLGQVSARPFHRGAVQPEGVAEQEAQQAREAANRAQQRIVDAQGGLDDATAEEGRLTAQQAAHQTALDTATAAENDAVQARDTLQGAQQAGAQAAKDAEEAERVAKLEKAEAGLKKAQEAEEAGDEDLDPIAILGSLGTAIATAIIGARLKVHEAVKPPEVVPSQLQSYAATIGA